MDWSSATESPPRCQECFREYDVKPHREWVARDSYLAENVKFMDESNPFTLDNDTKKCILQCKPGYWVENSDCNSEYIKSDGTICKNVEEDPL
jgi:hypothetical protein